jgi:prepilin-type processing-associated H-X9-DG protein
MAIALNRSQNGRAKAAGLTLVELMVVIAMTALLASIMLPALSTAKEKSRRAVCKGNILQVMQVCMEMYADENEQYLPSCGDDKGYYHSIVLSDAVFSNLVEMAGGNSNILYCPNITFNPGANAVQQHIPNIGYVIGYSYLAESIAGSSKSPDYTVEPVKLPTTGTPTNELLADANYWTPSSVSPGYFPPQMKIAPHTAQGAAMALSSSFTVGLPGNSVASVGAVGGNIGFADGHVEWRTLPQMSTNAASSLPDDAFGTW